jgi:ABC-2 type transport system ATP-binding protein
MTLQLQNVTKRFANVPVVENLGLEVHKGGVFGLLGSNGAGKTTTMRMILRILLPDEGEILWSGRPLMDGDTKRFGYLPEERGLYPKMTVRDQLRYLVGLRGTLSPQDASASVDEWISRLGLEPYRNSRLDKLSKGNQQKVQFAAAVAHKPVLVVLDEPFSGLDPLNAQTLHDGIAHLQTQGVTLLFSSHRLDQIEQLCTDVALLHNSRIIVSGALKDVKAREGYQLVRVVGETDAVLAKFPQIAVSHQTHRKVELRLPFSIDPQAVLYTALKAGPVEHFELAEPSLEAIYFSHVSTPGMQRRHGQWSEPSRRPARITPEDAIETKP